jgi:hypothetical protein
MDPDLVLDQMLENWHISNFLVPNLLLSMYCTRIVELNLFQLGLPSCKLSQELDFLVLTCVQFQLSHEIVFYFAKFCKILSSISRKSVAKIRKNFAN